VVFLFLCECRVCRIIRVNIITILCKKWFKLREQITPTNTKACLDDNNAVFTSYGMLYARFGMVLEWRSSIDYIVAIDMALQLHNQDGFGDYEDFVVDMKVEKVEYVLTLDDNSFCQIF